MSIHVEGPFGGCDEQAETNAFEELLRERTRADRLERILRECEHVGELDRTRDRTLVLRLFATRAKREGFTREEVEALLHLW